MIHNIRKGGTVYSINTKFTTPGFAALIRKNSDGETVVPFPQELLGMLVRSVVSASIINAVNKLLPAWVTDIEHGTE